MITQYEKLFNIELLKLGKPDTDTVGNLSIQNKYNKYVEKVLSPGHTVVLPCNGRKVVIGKPKVKGADPDEPSFILDGRYSRDVIDVYAEYRSNGKKRLRFYERSVRIQQLQASSGHHHAILGNFVVPYEKFSVRSALFLLAKYYSTSQTPEEFCDAFTDVEITVGQLLRLIDWAQRMFPHLGIDTTPAKETEAARRQAYKDGVLIILRDFQHYHELCIRITKMALFQKKRPVCSPFITGIPFATEA